ncbi:MAG: transglutaminase family protein [Actinomycetota bacterium]
MGAPVDAVERFAHELARPPATIRLDVAAFCIAAQAHPGLDVDAACARLDALAARCPAPTFAGVRELLFEREGFRGNVDAYDDPENSFLDSVLDRRIGIPITLSLVMMEVGRRIDVPVAGIGLPGHFIVADGAEPGRWCDPFAGGTVLDLAAVRDLARRMRPGPFVPGLLAPAHPVAIVARMLANLERGPLGRVPRHRDWINTLRAAFPGVTETERRRLRAEADAVRARWN